MTAPHFEYLNSINTGTSDDMVDESTYSSFMVNRGLSYFPDTIFYANEMNVYHGLDARLQYDFLRTAIRKRKRFSRWFKADKDERLDAVKQYFGYSRQKALEAMRVLTNEQVDEIISKLNTGGRG